MFKLKLLWFLCGNPSRNTWLGLGLNAGARPHAARTLGQEVLEGAAVEGVVILEFPTFDEAKAWYDSPAYREVREHRYKGADYRAVIVQGV